MTDSPCQPEGEPHHIPEGALEELLNAWSDPPVPPVHDHGQVFGDDGRLTAGLELKGNGEFLKN